VRPGLLLWDLRLAVKGLAAARLALLSTQGGTQMRRAIAAALSITAVTAAALAQSPVCADYLKKLEACVPKMPEKERGQYKKILEGYKELFKGIPEAAEGGCMIDGPRWKKDLPPLYGCTF
jgi:hypothetical protein